MSLPFTSTLDIFATTTSFVRRPDMITGPALLLETIHVQDINFLKKHIFSKLMEFFPNKRVLRAVVCLTISIHTADDAEVGIVIPMDVVHVALDLYSSLWKFASPRQCHPSMPKLSLGGDSFDVDEPEMIVDPTGTIARQFS
eukprot:PhF_6_TR10045/c0_g1_i2/m.15459